MNGDEQVTGVGSAVNGTDSLNMAAHAPAAAEQVNRQQVGVSIVSSNGRTLMQGVLDIPHDSSVSEVDSVISRIRQYSGDSRIGYTRVTMQRMPYAPPQELQDLRANLAERDARIKELEKQCDEAGPEGISQPMLKKPAKKASKPASSKPAKKPAAKKASKKAPARSSKARSNKARR